jgi:predicted RNA-binding protein with PUA-like domain
VIALDELRKHATKELKNMVLLRRGNRLSITPVEPAEWKFILSLE